MNVKLMIEKGNFLKEAYFLKQKSIQFKNQSLILEGEDEFNPDSEQEIK